MKKQILYLCLLLASHNLLAQELQEMNSGAGYNFQSYYSLATGEEEQVSNNAWDLAFSVGATDAGVFINESSGSNMGQPLPMIELYDAITTDFGSQPNPSLLEDYQLFNAEKSWSKGALNEAADPTDPLDFGWGILDPATQNITGERVFVVKLRNGQYRKLQVQSLIDGTYTFRYANLNGTGEATKTISKTDHAGKVLAYFSFTTGGTVSVEPAGGFDLFYCRYVTPFYNPGTMEYEPVAVMGILSGYGVQVAQANGVDPATVSYDDWVDSLSADIDVIGYDWKAFSGSTWLLYLDRAYFVKTLDGNIWKINFIDFGGSLTGTTIFEKTNLGGANTVNDPDSPLANFNVFPNPATSEANLVFSAKKAKGDAILSLRDATGKAVFQTKLHTNQGLNGYVLPLNHLQEGVYFAVLNFDNQIFTQRVVVVR
ncbi:MAG: T9SS type A sorting domain-containing protein [Bacteroidetes bacterium]|nr:T9SS type A sorting domain-containing protein [Bacteroidota bacterium]